MPRELRELDQWVLYRVQARNGKTTKVPYQAAHAGRKASSTDPATWGTFEAALAAHQRGRADGLGFVFTDSDPYAGVDLDACLRDGVIDEHARPIVAQLRSYTELSPSHTGLHVIGRGEVGGGRRTSDTPWGGELEVYDRGRYFTMTGERYVGTPVLVADFDEALAELRASLLAEPEPSPVLRGLTSPPQLDDRELLDKAFAARNGDKLRALWTGDVNGYKSQSEAELALLSILAFWTGPDVQRLDWLFRQSALVREKWDREEYRTGTIAKALSGRTEFYGQTAPTPLRAIATPENALDVASDTIRMTDTPIVSAIEYPEGRVILERADGLRMQAPSLLALTRFATLAGSLVAAFGHELIVKQEEKTATAHRFVAALRRHLGPGQIHAAEQRIEGWLVELVLVADAVSFETGDAEGRLRAWRVLAAADPEAERGAQAFASKVVLAHDLGSGDRYLRASWAQEYMRRCGWRDGLERGVGMLEAIGLEQPNSDGRVRAQWRAGGQTLTLRFWVIPAVRFDQWRADA